MSLTGIRILALGALSALSLTAGNLLASAPAEAATFRRVLWSENFPRYSYARQAELRARCAASAATAGVDYTEVRITAVGGYPPTSLFECIGVEELTITNPPRPGTGPTHTVNRGLSTPGLTP